MSDTKFNFSFNFNGIDTLVFSKGTTLGTFSVNSAISINPSIQSSVVQNMIIVNYTDSDGKDSTAKAIINSISVMRDFVIKTRYAVVLSGNIVTESNSMIYIVIPFITTASNNGTMNSSSIEQIVISANTQIAEGLSNTSLSTQCSLNNLISPGSQYYYKYSKVSAGVFDNKADYNSTFVIYKDDPGMISNKYTNLIALFNKADPNSMNTSNFMTNTFTPLVESTPINNEIMIDCAPVEITTPSGNILLTSKDKIFGNFEKTEINLIILDVIYGIILFVLLILVIYKFYSFIRADTSKTVPAVNGAGGNAPAGANGPAGAARPVP